MLKLIDTKTAISMGAPVGRLVEVLATTGWNVSVGFRGLALSKHDGQNVSCKDLETLLLMSGIAASVVTTGPSSLSVMLTCGLRLTFQREESVRIDIIADFHGNVP